MSRGYPHHHHHHHHPIWLFSIAICLIFFPNPSHSFHNSNNALLSATPKATKVSAATATTTSTSLSRRFSASSGDNEEDSSNNNINNMAKTDGISVGFIGCGTIASSIAKGLILAATSNNDNVNVNINSILVSRRSESKSKELIDTYGGDGPNKFDISISDDNQDILDRCDLIFLTVLPKQASSVLQSLKFDPNRHILVSLVSTANLQDLVEDSKLDLSRVSKMICLPSIARHDGVALLCCGDNNDDSSNSNNNNNTTKAFLTKLFNAMGGVVALDSERDLEACMVTTCTMGPLYGTMLKQRDWLLQSTASLSKADATFLVIKQFAGAISDAEQAAAATATATKDNDDDDDDSILGLANKLETLIEEQTPGGLNEQALRNYGAVLGGFEDIQQPVMDAILSRIRGETDGSIIKNK